MNKLLHSKYRRKLEHNDANQRSHEDSKVEQNVDFILPNTQSKE